MEHKPARVILVHQGDIVGRDHDGGSGLIEFDKQAQQPLCQARIDVAGWLVGKQQLRDARSRRGQSPRAVSRRRTALAERLACAHRARPIAAVPPPPRGSCFPDARLPAAAARHFHRWSNGRAAGNPENDSDRPSQGRQRSFPSVATSWPNTVMSPRVGRIDRNIRRSSEDLPAPDGPVRN